MGIGKTPRAAEGFRRTWAPRVTTIDIAIFILILIVIFIGIFIAIIIAILLVPPSFGVFEYE